MKTQPQRKRTRRFFPIFLGVFVLGLCIVFGLRMAVLRKRLASSVVSMPSLGVQQAHRMDLLEEGTGTLRVSIELKEEDRESEPSQCLFRLDSSSAPHDSEEQKPVPFEGMDFVITYVDPGEVPILSANGSDPTTNLTTSPRETPPFPNHVHDHDAENLHALRDEGEGVKRNGAQRLHEYRDWNELYWLLQSIYRFGRLSGLHSIEGFREARGGVSSWRKCRYLGTNTHGDNEVLRNIVLVVASRAHVPKWLEACCLSDGHSSPTTRRRVEDHFFLSSSAEYEPLNPQFVAFLRGKIRIVSHQEFFPVAAPHRDGSNRPAAGTAADAAPSWPSYNSNTIERYLHRIKGLSSFWLYFNNDMLLGRELQLFGDLFAFASPPTLTSGTSPDRQNPGKVRAVAASYILPVNYFEERGILQTPEPTKLSTAEHEQRQQKDKPPRFSAFLRYNHHVLRLLIEEAALTRRGDHYRYSPLQMNDKKEGSILSYAHTPTLFDNRMLRRLVAELEGSRDEQLQSGGRKAQRTETDPWIPFLYINYRRFHLSMTMTGTNTTTNTGSPHSLLGSGEIAFRSVRVAPRTGRNFSSLYYFALLRGEGDILELQKEVKSGLDRPLFITLNDNLPVWVNPNHAPCALPDPSQCRPLPENAADILFGISSKTAKDRSRPVYVFACCRRSAGDSPRHYGTIIEESSRENDECNGPAAQHLRQLKVMYRLSTPTDQNDAETDDIPSTVRRRRGRSMLTGTGTSKGRLMRNGTAAVLRTLLRYHQFYCTLFL